MTVSIAALMPLPLNGMGVGYTCGSLAKGMADPEFGVTIVAPRSRWPLSPVEVVEVLPAWARYAPYKWVEPWARSRIEDALLTCIDRLQPESTAAYLWPDASIETLRELKRRNVTVFREQFNCHTATAKRILDLAYERLGVTPQHGITARRIDHEVQVSEAVDHIFAPSPLVASSLLENGVARGKVLNATYGWDACRLAGDRTLIPSIEGITAIFVGAICVRKGAHLLLEYWARSGVRGRLVLAGELEPIIKEKCASLLSRDDVLVLNYFKDIGSLYRSADIFMFPSLEEGSPLVIYEACGSGLPILTTPMGAGWIIRPHREGIVLDPYDAPGWIDAIRLLAEDHELRRRMSITAAERSKSLTWATVARQRRRQITDCLTGHATAVPSQCGGGVSPAAARVPTENSLSAPKF